MKFNQIRQIIYAFILCFMFTSCQSQTNEINIKAFKNIRMYITKKQFNSFVDSLGNNDPLFNIVIEGSHKYCEFTETNEFGKAYKGYLLPTYTNGILTKLTVFYTPSSSPEIVTKYIQGDEQALVFWGDEVNRVQNDLNLKLQIKYGSSGKSGNLVSPHKFANYTYLYSEWVKDGMSIRLLQEIENDNGTNKYPFCNYLVEYAPSPGFIKMNKGVIDEKIRNNSSY